MIREGEPVHNLGRHGRVERGQHVYMTELEYYTVKDSRDWREVEVDEDSILVPEAVPCATEYFNLEVLPWTAYDLPKRLKRLRDVDLRKIAQAMASIGMCVPYQRPATTSEVYDQILEMAGRHGWLNQ